MHPLSPSNQLPLYGKRIIVTAPRIYGSRLSQQIINQGGLPIVMPTIETCLLGNSPELDAALRQIHKFDWIAFTSRNGIDAFFERMASLGISTSVLKNCQLSAIGKDAERLSDFGVTADLVPAEASPTGIVTELSNYPTIDQKTILVPIPEVVGIPEPNVIPNFISGLQELGMKVTPVLTYQTRILDKTIYNIELNLIRQGKIDVIAFSSTAEVTAFLTMVNSPQDYNHCVVACFGPYTAANTEKLGLTVSIVSESYSSFEGFANAIANFFDS
ncbi:uroporphyrinogen-III synthase [Moorena producens]|uniref:uroporphyrinogen-III synthase n=1 Tax=Moorena producens TaxID=1155739 RepID=UPI003C787833